MRTTNSTSKRIYWYKASVTIITCLLFLAFPSCQKDESYPDLIPDREGLSSSASSGKYKIHYGKLKDVEGNVYKTVKIGKQWWMAENLKTTEYNNGTSIPTVTDLINEWHSLTTPAYYVCNSEYGALYNWYAVNTGNLCPAGWHVPTDTEWTALIDYLGGANVAKDKLRETGTVHWMSPNPGATNEVGFTALPGGWIFGGVGDCMGAGSFGIWWTSTSATGSPDHDYGWYVQISVYKMGDNPVQSTLQRGFILGQAGMSVRCIKN